MSVNGHELIVTTAPEVCTQHETYDKLVKDYQDDGDFRKQFGALFYPTGQEKTGIGAILSKASIPNAGGLILGTVVTNMRWAAESRSWRRNSRQSPPHIPGIGYIFFGEILYEHSSRRLTLLRFQLGSKTGGEASAAESAFKRRTHGRRDLCSFVPLATTALILTLSCAQQRPEQLFQSVRTLYREGRFPEATAKAEAGYRSFKDLSLDLSGKIGSLQSY